MMSTKYLDGFGGYYSTEAIPGSLPVGQNSPQLCPYGLYAEQISGTAFTAPRSKNLRSWLYRIRPSVQHSRMIPLLQQTIEESFDTMVKDPNQLRWDPVVFLTDQQLDFVDSLIVKCGAGDPAMKDGLIVYDWNCNLSMIDRVFYSADGDFLIVPQLGTLTIRTEMGVMIVEPCEIVVIPRGIKFQVMISDVARGYAVEVFSGHLELPGLGAIGSNGLANARDFKIPTADFEDLERSYQVIGKFMNRLFESQWNHSPFDVVAWHGNYAPFKYDLRKFNCINSVTFDHPDPSIYTVLTCPSDEPGVAVLDFVIFPPRWIVADHTFRPPWFHRNCMSEFMGMIHGQYDAKAEGFLPGGSSLHSCMTGHGPDAETFIKASSADFLSPVYFNGGLAFMFESKYLLKVARNALSNESTVQNSYQDCWTSLPKLFNGETNPAIDWKALKESK
jgi:homogentisate 1,2-dioxygenase